MNIWGRKTKKRKKNLRVDACRADVKSIRNLITGNPALRSSPAPLPYQIGSSCFAPDMKIDVAPSFVKNTSDPSLGSPREVNCRNAAYQFQFLANDLVILTPDVDPPIVSHAVKPYLIYWT